MAAAAEEPKGKEASIPGDQQSTQQSTHQQSDDQPLNHHAQTSSAVQQRPEAAVEASRVHHQSQEYAESSAPPAKLEAANGRRSASANGMTLPAVINVEGADGASPLRSQNKAARQAPDVNKPEPMEEATDGLDAPGFIEIPPAEL